MDLKSILLPERAVKFDFPGCPGFKVELTFLSKESNQAIIRKCTITEINKKTRRPEQKLDEEVFLEEYVKAIIKGWEGFKIKYLKELVLINDDNLEDEDELDFSHEDAVVLMKNSGVFDTWVSEVVSDLGNFSMNNSTKKSKGSKATSLKAVQE